jgi:hypothetical protein
MLLDKGWKWREEEEENVSSYWITLTLILLTWIKG